MKKLLDNKAAPTDIAFQEEPSMEVNTDARSHTRLGWWIVIVGVGGFLLWATFAPLDKGVPISGTVAVATSRKEIQHPTGGIIQDILVKEGDVVKAGQTLVSMNDTQTRSLAEIARVQYFTASAAEARLTAERDEKRSITFPPELENVKDDPRVITWIQVRSATTNGCLV